MPLRDLIVRRLIKLTWTLLRGKRDSTTPSVVTEFCSTRVWATLILSCNRDDNRVGFFFIRQSRVRKLNSLRQELLSHLQQGQYSVHEVQNLLGIAAHKDSEAILRAIRTRREKEKEGYIKS